MSLGVSRPLRSPQLTYSSEARDVRAQRHQEFTPLMRHKGASGDSMLSGLCAKHSELTATDVGVRRSCVDHTVLKLFQFCTDCNISCCISSDVTEMLRSTYMCCVNRISTIAHLVGLLLTWININHSLDEL